MRLAIVSHKICSRSAISHGEYMTDGGFPLQVNSISELFSETRLLVPCEIAGNRNGLSPLVGTNLDVISLSVPKGAGLRRKLGFPFWLLRNGRSIWREVRKADAVHTPIPGDVGTIGMLFALLLGKPLFVRHCGNWLAQRTAAERFWKWSMERFAGGRNAMFATGGTDEPPSAKNPNIKWIFATSLRQKDLDEAEPRRYPGNGGLRLITACRLEERKGVDVVIESLPLILHNYPNARLDIVGDGSLKRNLERKAEALCVTEHIRFHGKVDQSSVIELMKRAHIFCFPTSASEGFPKVVIEALGCGLPVVATKVSVLPKLIGNDVGVLLDEAAGESVADAVTEIFADPDRYCRLSSAAVSKARSYSLESWRDYIGENLRRSWNVSSLSSG